MTNIITQSRETLISNWIPKEEVNKLTWLQCVEKAKEFSKDDNSSAKFI